MAGREIREPENSTVDDWFGQNVAEDQDVADRVVRESGGDLDEAEDRFEDEAQGRERYEKGHPRPDDDEEPDKLVADARDRGPIPMPPAGQPGEEDREGMGKAPGEGATG